jgi:rhodanese-related sulfurtransferase
MYRPPGVLLAPAFAEAIPWSREDDMKRKRLVPITVFAGLALAAASALPAAEKGFDDPARLARLVREGKPAYVLVDVRTPAEYESGHIPTAVNVPVDVIGTRPPTEVKDALIIVYCRSGNRSAAARKTLVDLGYTNVVDFGAVSRWERPLVTGKEPGKAP